MLSGNGRKSDFDAMKRRALSKKDKSRAGAIDEPIRNLVDLINSFNDYYTTSSCSGRVLIIAPSSNKKDSKWLFVSHSRVSLGDVLSVLDSLPPSGAVWFRVESFIVHVGCRDLVAADSLMRAARDAGCKHSGIMRLKPRIMAELIGNESIVSLLAKDGELLVDKRYLSSLVGLANLFLERNFARLGKLQSKLEGVAVSTKK